MKIITIIVSFIFLTMEVSFAGEADVVNVQVSRTGKNVYRFDGTIRHDDEGWDHYANGREVVSPDGTLLARRVLAHPQLNEQPVTRSLSGVKVPEGTKKVTVRSHDRVQKYEGLEEYVKL